jgi:YVTN family beta-propeller protein
MVPLIVGVGVFVVGPAVALSNGLPTHSSAIAVSSDTAAVWLVNPESGTAARIATSSLARVGEYAVGRNPRTLALDATHVFITAQDDDLIVRFDQADGSNVIRQQLQFGCAPFGVALNGDGTRVYVSCERTDTLIVLDTDLHQLAAIPVLGTPRGIAVSADGTHVYLSHYLTKEPSSTGHVSEIDTTTNTVSRKFDIPLDTSTCETINSAPGVYNFMSVIALTPPNSPAGTANQVWVAGTKENVAGKGLFIRSSFFKNLPEAQRFPFPFAGFPGADSASLRRNIFKPSFHEIIRSFIAKIDLTAGTVKEFIDVKGGNAPAGLDFSADGTIAYTVDRTSNRFGLFNSLRSGIVNDDPPAHGPGNCTANPFDIFYEGPLLMTMPPEVEQRADEPTLLEVDGEPNGIALTGLDYDVDLNAMKPISDGIGTTPIGIAVAPDGERAYSANSLARTVTVIDVRPGSYRCATPPHNACSTPLDCDSTGAGVCANGMHGGQIQLCMNDAECDAGIRCVHQRKCMPQILGVVNSTDHDPLPPELLDGEILFSTSARDASLANNIGLQTPVPPNNFQDPATPSRPGEVVSTGHDAEYLACTSCHAETGNDGRTWDNSQFGASLRNTGDLRGRASLAPGTCSDKAADSAKTGRPCTTDSDCGSGSPLTTCQANPKFVPLANPLVAPEAHRFFNPMGTIHWNADRDEVEDFEHAFRTLQGAGDCDGNEHLPEKCIGALIMRSHTTDPVNDSDDLGAPNRAIPGTSGIAGIRLTHMADYVYSETEYVRNPNIGAHGEVIVFAARRGRAIFNDPRVGCARCHNGPSDENQQFTDKRPLMPGEAGFDPNQPVSATNNPYLRHDVGTANIFDKTDPFMIADTTAPGGVFPNRALPIPGSRGALTEYLTPTLVDVWNTAPYLHDGSAATLLDVVMPCNSHFEDCNAAGTGRNLDDRHGRTSILSRAQLDDLVAFLKAPHGPVGNGDDRATLTITTAATAAPDFGFTFPIPINGARIGMTINSRTGMVTMNGADFPIGVFHTIGGDVAFNVDDDVFTGTIDSVGNISIPNVGMTQALEDAPIRFTFNLTTKTSQLPMDDDPKHIISGAALNRSNGSVTLVDIQLSPPDTPVLGTSTPTTLKIVGTLDCALMQIERVGEITGVVTDGEGHAVTGASVRGRGGRRAVTGTDGRFRIARLALGQQTIRASRRGVGRGQIDVFLSAAAQTRDVTLQLH